MREMNCHDVFISRLKLLVIMAKAYLAGYPLGEHRKKAIVSTARQVAREVVDWGGHVANFRGDHESLGTMGLDHIFFQRVKLLAVMAGSFAEDYPIGYHRRRSIEDNLDKVCETISFNNLANDMSYLKIA